MATMRCFLFVVAFAACGKSGDSSSAGSAAPTRSASAAGFRAGAGSGSGSATASGSGSAATASGSGSASGSATPSGLALNAGEKRHDPNVEMPWIPPAGHVTVTLVDVADTAKLVVWGDGKRHDVV